MEKQITKNQHYVPQLLLRNFSVEEKGEYRCSIYDFKRQQLRHRQNIKDVFSRNYMYDKDNMVENFIGENVEDQVVAEIELILSNTREKLSHPSISLLRFITVQLARTQQAYEQALDFNNEMMKTVFEEITRLNDLDIEAARKLSIVPTDPSAVKAHQALAAALNWPLLRDLKNHLLIIKSESEFVISDHPVFQYNWYLRDSKELMVSSVGAVGIQLFFPLSPKICYCLYDSAIYKYGTARSAFTEISNDEDVPMC